MAILANFQYDAQSLGVPNLLCLQNIANPIRHVSFCKVRKMRVFVRSIGSDCNPIRTVIFSCLTKTDIAIGLAMFCKQRSFGTPRTVHHTKSCLKLSYPISTLPEHLHSISLSYAETTLNSRKLISFPLIAHYLSAGPPLAPHPPSPGDPATPTLTHHSLVQRPRSRTCFWPLSLVMFASPLRL